MHLERIASQRNQTEAIICWCERLMGKINEALHNVILGFHNYCSLIQTHPINEILLGTKNEYGFPINDLFYFGVNTPKTIEETRYSFNFMHVSRISQVTVLAFH